MIFRLPDDDTYFPDPHLIPESERDPDGLYAIGGDLSTERLLEAYAQGIFPWTSFRDLEVEEGEEPQDWNLLRWYCPMQRFVIFPHEVHISHSMRSLLRKGVFEVTRDECFERVIEGCSVTDGRIDEDGAWLGPQIIEAYTRLHRVGVAHSVEVWQEGDLVGGLYGILVGGVFVGESMFSRVPSASKVALIHLCQFMQEVGGKFIDCQLETPHLRSMGGRYISYDEYMDILYSVTPKKLS